MITRDEIDGAISQCLPESIAVCALANGRCALERCRTILDVAGHERQVMRASLDGDRHGLPARDGERCHRVGRRKMNDVDSRAVLASQSNQEVDGALLTCGWPALKPGRIAAWISLWVAEQGRELGVH